jgi:hypothetical protein
MALLIVARKEVLWRLSNSYMLAQIREGILERECERCT